MLVRVLNLLLIANVSGVHQVTPLELDIIISFIISVYYLEKSKFHRFLFYVTEEQIFHVVALIIVSRDDFLNEIFYFFLPFLFVCFCFFLVIGCWHFFSELVNDQYFFKWNQLVILTYVQNILYFKDTK